MKHIGPLVDLFNQLVVCSAPHTSGGAGSGRERRSDSGLGRPHRSAELSPVVHQGASVTDETQKVSIKKRAWNQRIDTAYPEIGDRGITTDKGRVVMLAKHPYQQQGGT